MGRRGPAPTPTPLRVLRGETRPSRLKPEAPAPVTGLPEAPDDLSPAARTVWQRVMRAYGATGVITEADADGLRAYCEAVVRYVHAQKALEASGPLVRDAHRSGLVKNPLHQIVRDNAEMMRAWARELGLTPAARVGLRGESMAPASPMTEYLARGRRSSA